jgi:hypothetical protein
VYSMITQALLIISLIKVVCCIGLSFPSHIHSRVRHRRKNCMCGNYFKSIEELDGPAVSALRVRSRKLSNVLKSHRMVDQNLLSRAPQCFGWYVKPLFPAAFVVVSINSSFKEGRSQAGGRS